MLNKQGMTREQMEALLAELFIDYNQDNNNLTTVKNIAGVYEKMEDFDQALAYYNWALTLNPSDVSMQRKIELLVDKVQDMKIAALEAGIDADPHSPDAEQRRADLTEIKRQRGMKAVEEAKQRVERNPTDKAYRFDLGQAFFNGGMFGEAIPELQQARQNPNLRIKALLMLGKCFEKKNMNDLAINAFSDAAKDIAVMDNTKKELLYDLAMEYATTSGRGGGLAPDRESVTGAARGVWSKYGSARGDVEKSQLDVPYKFAQREPEIWGDNLTPKYDDDCGMDSAQEGMPEPGGWRDSPLSRAYRKPDGSTTAALQAAGLLWR
jgi:tetratricopeptide (TPR) repeat protein